jgi:glycosyltransferase 2 family protein
MNKKLINLIVYTFTFGLCAFLIWLSVKDLKPEDITRIKYAVSKANYFLLLPIILMGIISHWSRAMRWRILMEPLDMFPGIVNVFFAVMIGYLTNLLLPRFGEVVKCTILAKYEKTPADKLVGTIITERAFDFLCLLIILFLTIIVQVDLANSYLQTLLTKFNSNGTSSTLSKILILGIPILIILLTFIFRKQLGQNAFIQKIKKVFINILTGIMSFKNMSNKSGFIFHTILIWSMYLGMIVLGFQSIQETNQLGFKTSLSVLSFGSFGMIATPGGMGAYTLLVDEIVQLYGIEKAISVAISWIIWLVPTVIILLTGIFSLIVLPIYNSKKNAK